MTTNVALNTLAPSFEWTSATSGMTIEFCVEVCRGEGKSLALLHDQSCYCQDDTSNLIPALGQECDTPCAGNLQQQCGGVDREALNVYATSDGESACFV